MNNPEQVRLRDTLYTLQSAREMSGREQEPALLGGEFEIDCSVFIDKKTDDRIVLTHLPIDEADFEGATVWLSNPNGIKTLSYEVEELDDQLDSTYAKSVRSNL